jgi:NAD(P)-dependent dehydrogenase (short-subunit alcohol dehydrogenase family)
MALTGKVAMIRAIARRLAAEGCDLVLTDVAPTGTKVVAAKPTGGWRGLDAVAQEVKKTGRRAITALVDVRSTGQIDAAVRQALDAFGRIDVLINNAAAPPGADRVAVAAICPGTADTHRLDYLGRRPDGSFDPALRGQEIKIRGASVPVGRLATAEDVAEVAAFLVSDGAEYITGQAINVAGGSIMH